MSGSFTSEFFRVVRLFSGLFAFALGVVMTLRANVGYPPWDVFHQGLGMRMGITIGQANILVATVIVSSTFLMKEKIGVGTICNMLFIGVFMDIILSSGWVPLMRTFVSGVAMMVGGLFVVGMGTVLYMGSGYGAGPRDSLMVILTKRTGKPAGFCRSCIESTALITGWLLGGYAGVGTVISAFGIGMAVQAVFYVLRFDVNKIRQESCYETFTRLGSFGGDARL
ncbi:MAG: hypothetical protein FWG71_04670 [Synergistaceae bacterium]|nr:hypothetical protein [Synergistaceae bacterium]